MAETPSWAIYGAEEEGFDPIDARYIHTLTITLYTKLTPYTQLLMLGIIKNNSNLQTITSLYSTKARARM
jgi:hypothetical protein